MRSRLEDQMTTDRPQVVFLGDDIDEEDHDLLFPALRERGVSVIRVHPHDLVTHMDARHLSFSVNSLPINPDLVVGWVLDDLLTPGMAQLDVLARAGIPVINDALTLFRAQNKYIDSSMLSAGGALRYPVISGRDPQALATWFAELNGPAVTKPVVGFGGRGLQRLTTPKEQQQFIDEITSADEEYYVVPWIDNPGRDIRVYTINHHPVFAIYRYAPTGGWITNVRAGGELAMCPLTAPIMDLARRASQSAGTLIGGVDIAENQATGELVVYEVNSCPTCEPPALEALADFLTAAALDLEAAQINWQPSKVYEQLDTDLSLFHRSKHDQVRQSVKPH